MTNFDHIREQIANLRSFDEGAPPADGWWIAWKDLCEAADTLEALLRVAEAADEWVDLCGCCGSDIVAALEQLQERET